MDPQSTPRPSPDELDEGRDEPPPVADEGAVIAAVDLGSNSFHMLVARHVGGQIQVLDRLREPVRLASGLSPRPGLDPQVAERALDCLRRFGQRVGEFPSSLVRAVGTNTMRKLNDGGAFLRQAESALGHPIEVISGFEEARLIYLGVAMSLSQNGAQRLVVDIGGGSTELIIGRGLEPFHLDSLYMGCVSMSQAHFADGVISRERMREAELRARLELRSIRNQYRYIGWDVANGASGSVRAVRRILIEQGWSESGITAKGLSRLRKAMIEAGHLDQLKLKGLSEDRKPVLAGGVAILWSIFKALEIEQMTVATGALREGLLYDLIGRLRHEDVRELAVANLLERFRVDGDHAALVEGTAMHMLSQAGGWGLSEAEHGDWLHWAASLHELGLALAHSGYHKHGAYILGNADLPGFSIRDQRILAAMVRGHRRKFPRDVFEALPGSWQQTALRLTVILRLAVLLHRSRSHKLRRNFSAEFEGSRVRLRFPEDWLDEHPMNLADLAEEQGYLRAVGIELEYG